MLDDFAAVSRVARHDIPHAVLVIGERPERTRHARAANRGDRVNGENLVHTVSVEVPLDDLA